ncbi:MAG TPA: DUF4097 family beta strand repeat-containing protein [Bryobacteraceae bacterium]|nr:DUF4097 family beta strand repeat-containing protein [Bryobacteraceae bacterium]
MRTNILVVSLAAGLLGFAGCDIDDLDIGGSERYTQDFHYSYALQPGGRLSVDNSNGSIEISGWDQNTIDISGTKYARTPELRDALKIEIDHTADAVRIRTVRPSDRRGNMGAKYIIKVPRRTQLERIVSSNGSIHTVDVEGPAHLKTSNGAVRAEDLQGSLDVQTSNGSINVQNLEGSVSLHTSNGQVHADDVRGAVEASTSNGGIHVRVAKPESGRPIKLETTNGGIELTMESLNQNEIHASTSNGGITVHLPSGINANVTASASNSSISTEFDVATQGTLDKHHLEGKIGAGGPEIDLSTSNGSIRLLKKI